MSSRIGERVSCLRKSAGMTKQELSMAASVDGAILERLEEGNVTPSISVINRICKALGTRTGTVLDGDEPSGPVCMTIGNFGVHKHCDYISTNLHYHMLAGQKSDRNMEPVVIDVEFSADDVPLHHEGEEFIYIVSGNAILHYGNKKYFLKQGDSIYFDSCIPHSLNPHNENETARVLSVTYVPVK